MQFQPKTREELAASRLLPDGDYPFTVQSAEDRVSKAGNEMTVVDLIVYAEDGSQRGVTDYLMERMAYKLHEFCEATGLQACYSAGKITAEDCLGKSGYVSIKTEPGRPKADKPSETWPPKNVVRGYKKSVGKQPPAAAPKKESAPPADNTDEDVPF